MATINNAPVAPTTNMPGIKNSWSFFDFCRANGRMKRGTFTYNGEQFQSLIFPDSPNKPEGSSVLFLSFSSKLGELSHSELVARRNELQVVELNSGTFKLCAQGEGAWEDENIWDE